MIKFKFLDQRKNDSVKITHIYPHHTNICAPSKDQLVMVRTAAGDYENLQDLFSKIWWI